MYGHQLNAHYLLGIYDALEAGRPASYTPAEGGPEAPRLFAYFDGQTPEPYHRLAARTDR